MQNRTASQAMLHTPGKWGLPSSAHPRAALHVAAKRTLQNRGARFDPQRSREAGRLGSWQPQGGSRVPQRPKHPRSPHPQPEPTCVPDWPAGPRAGAGSSPGPAGSGGRPAPRPPAARAAAAAAAAAPLAPPARTTPWSPRPIPLRIPIRIPLRIPRRVPLHPRPGPAFWPQPRPALKVVAPMPGHTPGAGRPSLPPVTPVPPRPPPGPSCLRPLGRGRGLSSGSRAGHGADPRSDPPSTAGHVAWWLGGHIAVEFEGAWGLGGECRV